MSEEYEIVFNPNTKKGWYIRRVPYTRKYPTQAQQRQQAAFARAAISTYDETGYRIVDGQLLPPAAAAVKEQMSGQQLTPAREVPPAALATLLRQLQKERREGTIHVSVKTLKQLALEQEQAKREEQPIPSE